MRAPVYAPLWCKSNYSFLEGASHPEEYVRTAWEYGLPGLALTDRHGLYGVVRAYQEARSLASAEPSGQAELTDSSAPLKLICGAQIEFGPGEPEEQPPESTLVLLVQSLPGWQRLCRLLTVGARRGAKGQARLRLEEVAEAGGSGGLIALWGGPDSSLYRDHDRLWRRHGAVLTEAFGDRLYAALPRHRLAQEQRWEPRAATRAHRLGLPLLAVPEVLYHRPERRRLQDVLTCVRRHTTLREAGRALRANSGYALLSPEQAATLYADRPEALARTLEVAERCAFTLDQLHYRYPHEEGEGGQDAHQRLARLVWAGAAERYGNRSAEGGGEGCGEECGEECAEVCGESCGNRSAEVCAEVCGEGGGESLPDQVRELIEHELKVIFELEYVGYFLTMLEIVNECRRRGILCQGRGSAANSVVCYCLGITAVDPVGLGLLFERFISVERAEPPDIDLDIAHQRREEVIAWVYQRYGRERAAMVANLVRYRPRSAVRDVGKVLEIEVPAIERIARLLSGFSTELAASLMELAGVDPQRQARYRLLFELVNELLDFPRHLSIHPGGFLLGRDPVCELVPIEPATMEGRTVIQWDKYDVEALGLFKVDLLGLGALSQIDRAFGLIARHWGRELCMESVPANDEATYRMLSAGDTVGVFQVESRAQMAMLPSMQPRRFYDLVIQVAIVRPGPITGGMVHPYLRRRTGLEQVDYPHPKLEPVLAKTLGVPLFQEQVMKLAMVAADYSPGEADMLRRDMAAWRSKGKLERHRDRLISRMQANGIEEEFAERVFAQIQGFGEYGFPESHAASFALITYVAAYLRCHYPEAFVCALLNSLPMGFYSASTLLEDARRHGVEVRPFCVERSQWECTLEPLEAPPQGTGAAGGIGMSGASGGGQGQLALFSEPQLGGAAWYGARGESGAGSAGGAGGESGAGGAGGGGRLALRLGLKFLKGLPEAQACKIVELRPFRSTRELVGRCGLDRGSLEKLAASGALAVYGRSRRSELWSSQEHLEARHHPLFEGLGATGAEAGGLDFPELDEDGLVLWDYEAAGLSARGHPMRLLRPALSAAGFPDARTLRELPDGRRARYAAMVICRQRPATAKGTVFMTLEDETGLVNVVVWSQVYDQHFVVARSAGLLGVEGRIQKGKGVVHLVARRLFRPDLTPPTEVSSRNFH